MAKTKKNWARRGRPRTADVDRTDSGRISRAKPGPKDIGDVVLAYRQLQYGLPPELAGHEKACTVLGRLWLRTQKLKDDDPRKVTTPMREAGEMFLGHYDAAMRADKAPVGLAKGGPGGTGPEEVTQAYCDWVFGAIGEYRVHKQAMIDIGAWQALDHVVLRDQECLPDILDDLMLGLQTLAVRYGKVPRDKDAGKIVAWAAQ